MNSIENFWNQRHSEDHLGSLSGCGYEETIEFLRVESLIKPGLRVLEIGVGLGYVTQGFKSAGALVSALDISPVALDRVNDLCEQVFLIDQLDQLPDNYFDLVICHNVVQHVPTEALTKEFEHVLRSLRVGGVFAVEYVWRTDIEDDGQDPPETSVLAGHLCRSDSFMIDLAKKFGGHSEIARTNAVPGHRKIQGLTVLHITKPKFFDGKRIFISGATGSWGQTLTRMLLENYNPAEIVCFSRGELQQVLMQRRFQDPRLKFIIGDVRDYEAVRFAMSGVDIVFHLAALKHVPVCEDHPQEAIKTNIVGTTNIVNAAIENKVDKVIDVSTDKAVEPLNLYGMTKSVGEKLIIQANSLSDHTRFVCVRGGNVMGSNGSVIPYFIEQIKAGGPLTITDLKMTRFFLTLEEAIGLLFKAAEHSLGGETFVMNMPACRIADVAQVLMNHYGHVEVTEMGAKPGEKLDEMLISRHEAPLSCCYDDTYYVILPTGARAELHDCYEKFDPLPYDEFSSGSKLMDLDEIEIMLQKGGFLCE